ncbi:MAG: tRNA (5-methylaminomethyl-2-thiouridine)(34)-methyltransferase MnmD [Mucilaginibacter polytrichastri]|nr:tRNA (5-methylaminomethyl-2-thiouridine)(34)-methyltransferase MnmD [Mucilaginibacter polytrichastri]
MNPAEKERHLVRTADGSYTLYQPDVGEHYHSVNGALAESRHVFLESGLQFFMGEKGSPAVRILEVGFGTGLNFLLSWMYCAEKQIRLDYTGIEAFPLPLPLMKETGYEAYVGETSMNTFYAHYPEALLETVQPDDHTQLRIENTEWPVFTSEKGFDVVYFDAFASARQPEMWEDESIGKAASLLEPGGVFVTYAITGKMKRQFRALGFRVQKIPGAPGKREMLRAIKL